MKKSKFTESQIVQALKEHEAGKNVDDICRHLGINRNTLYNWKKQYLGINSELMSKSKELEQENSGVKNIFADLSLDDFMFKEVNEEVLQGYV